MKRFVTIDLNFDKEYDEVLSRKDSGSEDGEEGYPDAPDEKGLKISLDSITKLDMIEPGDGFTW